MQKKIISVIIPAYNCEKTISDCIISVLKQTRKELIKEIVVVNDGSSDNTLIVLNNLKLESDIPIKIINQKNEGVSAARNNAVLHASGEWLAFLDSDDVWLEKKLEIQEEKIDREKKICFIGGNINEKEQIIGWSKHVKYGFVQAKDMIIRSFPQTSTVLVKRKLVEEFEGFDKKQGYCEDMNLFVKIAYRYRYFHINKQLVFFGGGKAQIGSKIGLSSNMKLMNQGALKNLKDFMQIGILNKYEYYFFYILNQIKYIRRIIIANWVK